VKFDEWLHTQRAYQAETFEIDYPRMAVDVNAKTDYVTMNLNAAFLELAEAQQEVPWKPWATAENREKKWAQNRDKFVGEMVDVLFFVANALTAVNCSDEELAVRYQQKIDVNKQRMATGYDGSNKCTQCGRAFDDTHQNATLIIRRSEGQQFCDTTCEEKYLR
jgi:hypothetical protein